MGMKFLPKDVFQVVAIGAYRIIEEFDNYNKAVEKFNDLKGKYWFDSVELVLIRTLEEVTNNGNDN